MKSFHTCTHKWHCWGLIGLIKFVQTPHVLACVHSEMVIKTCFFPPQAHSRLVLNALQTALFKIVQTPCVCCYVLLCVAMCCYVLLCMRAQCNGKQDALQIALFKIVQTPCVLLCVAMCCYVCCYALLCVAMRACVCTMQW